MGKSETGVTASAAEQFISSVLKLQPKLAVFDCDGTLWSGDGGQDFLFKIWHDSLAACGLAEAC